MAVRRDRINRFEDGLLWDRAGVSWRRAEDWVDPGRVRSLLDGRVGWLIEWCEGELQWDDNVDLSVLEAQVLPSLLTREKARRLAMKKRQRTVFVAELWNSEPGTALLLFHESGPSPRSVTWFA